MTTTASIDRTINRTESLALQRARATVDSFVDQNGRLRHTDRRCNSITEAIRGALQRTTSGFHSVRCSFFLYCPDHVRGLKFGHHSLQRVAQRAPPPAPALPWLDVDVYIVQEPRRYTETRPAL